MTTQSCLIYRSMKPATDGLPELAPSATALGVRSGPPSAKNIDIAVDENNFVEPYTGGMSVTIRDVKKLPQHRRPPELEGTGRYPVFVMESRMLNSRLQLRADSQYHALVEPISRCKLSAYTTDLEATRPYWRRYDSKN